MITAASPAFRMPMAQAIQPIPAYCPKAQEGSDVAYKVEIWSNDSGLVYHAEDK
jgi:hypothetical protein